VRCDIRELEDEYMPGLSMMFWVVEQHDPGLAFYDRILVRFPGGRQSLGVIKDYHTRMKAGRADITEPMVVAVA
jgi:hypothetical protein